jgi:MoaA/NifB/PqqE/SkfB family radical SAM enzyme
VWKNPAPELDTEGVKKVLLNLSRSSLFLVSLEGGEPLLREDIGEILEFTEKLPFFILFTTGQRDILDYPWERYTRYIDFLHISIDEGHNNLELFEVLGEMTGYGSIVTVQTVVSRDEIGEMKWKVEKCAKARAKILIMPAVKLDGARDLFPEWSEFRKELLRLKKKYPEVVTTPRGYVINYERGICSSSSIIIDCDGGLFYPCRTLDQKPINLTEIPLMEFLRSGEAELARQKMAECQRNCGWYQYFATDIFTSPLNLYDGIRPYFRVLIKP